MIDYEQIFTGRLTKLKPEGAYRYFPGANKSAQHFPYFYYQNLFGNRKTAINCCSHDYPGVSTQEEIVCCCCCCI